MKEWLTIRRFIDGINCINGSRRKIVLAFHKMQKKGFDIIDIQL